MIGLALVRPLETDWRDTLDMVARRRGWPSSGDVNALARHVIELSATYNDASIARASVRDAGAARLGFAFARDVPKGAAAVRELVATATLDFPAASPAPTPSPVPLASPASVLRFLDVGAGLGATTWGVVRALEAAGRSGVVEATWLDPDAHALDIAAEVARERARAFVTKANDGPPAHGRVEVRATTSARPVGSKGALDDLGKFDVVLVGQLLSELDVGIAADRRIERHAALLGDMLERHVVDGGALVVIEPALRDRTRHLHHVRDSLAAIGVTIFAPCMHALSCPALSHDSDWCHEDVSVDLPPWLVPVARAAGLRHQGLTFSYLVLRKDGARLADLIIGPPAVPRLRLVSDPMPSKGKHEAFVCGPFPPSEPDGSPRSDRVRATRLDRDATDVNAGWTRLKRGDVIVVDPPLSLAHPRIGATTRISGAIHPPKEHA